MTFDACDCFGYRLPLTAPLSLKGVVWEQRRGWLVRLTDAEGRHGWGEASPLPGFSQETPDAVRRDLGALRAALAGRTFTSSPVDPDGDFARWLEDAGWAAAVRVAVEGAAWSLYAAAHRRTLTEVLHPHPRTTVPLNGLLLGTGAEVVRSASRLRAAGYPAVKLKVGRQPVAADVAMVHAVADALGGAVRLRLDANRAWHWEDACAFAEGLADVAIEYIEEPLAEAGRLAAFAAQTGLPVALDETVLTLTPEALAEHRYADALLLKPTLLGGVVPTRRWVRQATALGLTPVLSAAFETGLGLRMLVALAAAWPEEVAAGLDTYRWLAEDVLTPRLAPFGPWLDAAALLTRTHQVRLEILQPAPFA